MALVLERRATKDDILELYLNDIPLGQRGSFGIRRRAGGGASVLRKGRQQRVARPKRRPLPASSSRRPL